ncbi:MAG TPA: tripartite tricarboxylate transporter substrate binding protein [Rubrivivax sp.]
MYKFKSSASFRVAAAACATALVLPHGAHGQAAYPNKLVQLIAQQPPGSQSEAISRIWSECASRELGQAVIVVSKPGANGVLATNFLKSQPADGYTIMTVGMSQMTITPYVYKNLPYDVEKDFDGVAVLSTSPLLLVASTQSGIKKVSDIAAFAAKQPGGVNYGSPGKGSPAHLLTAAVAHYFKAEGTHVPFVGESAGATALMGGQIDIMTLTSGTAGPLIKDGRIVALSVYTEAREKAFADVPTIVESTGSKDLARPGWLALVVKAGTPAAITKRLGDATTNCVRSDPAYRAKLETVHVSPIESSPADVKAWTDRYSAVFRPIITRLGLTE